MEDLGEAEGDSRLLGVARHLGNGQVKPDAKSLEHVGNPSQVIKYDTNPPTTGQHYEIPAEDQAFILSITVCVDEMARG